VDALVWFLLVLALCVVLYLVELRESAQQVHCERRRRHSRWRIWGFGVLAVIGASLVSFFVLNDEPVNAIGFMALAAVVGQLVHSDFSGKLLRAYDCYRRCAKPENECGSPCVLNRCEGGQDDEQKDDA
jgi:hypothetical protein